MEKWKRTCYATGVKSDVLHDKLLQTLNLSLSQCLQLCKLSEHSSSSLRSSMEYIQEHVDAINKFNKCGSHNRGDITSPKQQHITSNTNHMRIQCNRCGYIHNRGSCPAKGKQCANCGKLGHFANMCMGRRGNSAPMNEIIIIDNSKANNWVTSMEDDEQQLNEDLFISTLANNDRRNGNLWHKNIQICGQEMCFKLDTGSEVNLAPKSIFKTLRGTPL